MWEHIVIEGFCLGKDKPPCGRPSVSTFCLRNGHCPRFGYAESNPRETACFVPLYLLMVDKLRCWWEELYPKLHWYLWGKFFFKKRWEEFRKYAETHTAECPAWDNTLAEADRKFPQWFEKVKRSD